MTLQPYKAPVTRPPPRGATQVLVFLTRGKKGSSTRFPPLRRGAAHETCLFLAINLNFLRAWAEIPPRKRRATQGCAPAAQIGKFSRELEKGSGRPPEILPTAGKNLSKAEQLKAAGLSTTTANRYEELAAPAVVTRRRWYAKRGAPKLLSVAQ
jgi:hypothetical protein